MRVILDKKFYGYCPGLLRSFNIANSLIKRAEKEDRAIFCDVPLAHNSYVMADLRKRGVQLIEVTDQTRADNSYFLISAHGASHQKLADLEKKGFEIINATCLKVSRVQNQAIEDFKNGYQIVIFGKDDHPEVIGINDCINNQAIILNDPKLVRDLKLVGKTSIISQTTKPSEKFDLFIKTIKKNNPNIEIVVRKTTCPIVKSRIKQIIDYVSNNDIEVVVVVGSSTSSNTRSLRNELTEICQTMMVSDERGIFRDDFIGTETVLVVSGTSAPPEIVEKVAQKIESFGL